MLDFKDFNRIHNLRDRSDPAKQATKKQPQKRLKTPAQIQAEELKKKRKAEEERKQREAARALPIFDFPRETTSRVVRERGATPPPISPELPLAEPAREVSPLPSYLPRGTDPRPSILGFFRKSTVSTPSVSSTAESGARRLNSGAGFNSLPDIRFATTAGTSSTTPIIIEEDEPNARSLFPGSPLEVRGEEEEDLGIGTGRAGAGGEVWRRLRRGHRPEMFPVSSTTTTSSSNVQIPIPVPIPRSIKSLPEPSKKWIEAVTTNLGKLSEPWDRAHPIKSILKKWVATGECKDLGSCCGTCEACGKKNIRYEFKVKHLDGTTLKVGSDCIQKFTRQGAGYRKDESHEPIYGDEAILIIDDAIDEAHKKARAEKQAQEPRFSRYFIRR